MPVAEDTTVDTSAADKAAADAKAAANKAASDQAAADKAAADKAAADKAAADAANAGKTPEQIAAEKAAAEETARKAADQAKAPEKYTLTLPEGGPLTAAELPAIEAEAKALGLTNDEAQALLSVRAEQLAGLQAQYLTEAKADPEIGGAKFDETVRLATAGLDKALTKYSTPDDAALIKRWFSFTGLGNHRAYLRFFRGIGQALAEDTPVQPGAVSKAERRSNEEVMFSKSLESLK